MTMNPSYLGKSSIVIAKVLIHDAQMGEKLAVQDAAMGIDKRDYFQSGWRLVGPETHPNVSMVALRKRRNAAGELCFRMFTSGVGCLLDW